MEAIKPELKEALASNYKDAEIAKLKILTRGRNNEQISYDKENQVKCILKNIQRIRKEVLKVDGGDKIVQDTTALNSQIESLKEEKKNLEKHVKELESESKQLWLQVGDSGSNSPQAVDIIHKAEKEILSLKNQLNAEKEKNLDQNATNVKQDDGGDARLKEKMEKEKNRLDAKMKNIQDHCRQLSEELNAGTQDIEDTITQAKSEIQKLKKDVRHLQMTNGTSQGAVQASDNTKQETGQNHQELEAELNTAKKEIDELQKQLKTLQDEQGKLRTQNEKEQKSLLRVKEELSGKDQMIAQLKAEITDANNKVTELENKLKTKQKELEENKAKQKDLQKKLEKDENKTRVKQLENERNQLKAKTESMQKHIDSQECGDEAKFLRNQVKDLTDRLAEEMNAKVSADESALENINIANRPMKLAEEYQQFCTDTWLNAKQVLDELQLAEEQSSLLLKDIMMISQVICDEAGKGVNAVLMQLLREPVKKEFSKPGKSEKEMTEAIPESARALFNGVGDHLRRTADKVNLDVICKEVTTQMKSKHTKEDQQKVFEKKEMKTYIGDSVRMTWKMVIQRPAMTLSTEGEKQKFNQEKQEIAWGSHPENKGAVVRYYIHPVLKHGDRVMAKGRVMVK